MLTEAVIEDAVARYLRELDRFEKLARTVEDVCRDVIRESNVPAQVTARAKDPGSLRRKLHRYLSDGPAEKARQLCDVDAVFVHIGDLAGVRVATYVEADRERIVSDIASRLSPPRGAHAVDVDRKQSALGYRATHCQVGLPRSITDAPGNRNLEGLSCEIQVTSMLAHVWNEIEHDIRYKSTVGSPDDLEESLLTKLLSLTQKGDVEIESLLLQRSERVAESLLDDVAAAFGSLPNFRINALEIVTECVRIGLSTSDAIATELWDTDPEAEGRSAVDAFNEEAESAGEQVRLNPSDADVLLALLLRRRARDIAAIHWRTLSGDRSMAPKAALAAAVAADSQSLRV